MKIRYVGPSSSVVIPATGQTAERGKTVEVVDAVAKQLVKQESWKKVTTKKKES